MKLIVGLGNPGDQYKYTRHNAGFMAVDYLAKAFDFDGFKEVKDHKALVSEGQIDGEKVFLIKPQTFMNLSGQSVRSISNFYKIPLEDIIIIYDDVDIPFETLRIRMMGSAGGHNGIKSLIQELGTDEFTRVRLGIRPEKPFPGALEDYVLGKLTEDEKAALNIVIDKLPAVIQILLKGEVKEAMNRFNG